MRNMILIFDNMIWIWIGKCKTEIFGFVLALGLINMEIEISNQIKI